MATDGTCSMLEESSGSSSAVETKEDSHLADSVELNRLKEECAQMINTLKALDEEEKRLREGNHILAQKAVLMGCTGGFDTGARRGAGRKRPATSSTTTASAAKKAAVAKPSKNNSTTPSSVVNMHEGAASPPKTPLIAKANEVVVVTSKEKPNVREKCEHIMNVIYRHGIFTNLTHPARVAEGFVDLTIHMRVIQKKIESNAFATRFDLFKADVHNMFDTCILGSREGSPFFDVIKELKKQYEFELANLS